MYLFFKHHQINLYIHVQNIKIIEDIQIVSAHLIFLERSVYFKKKFYTSGI